MVKKRVAITESLRVDLMREAGWKCAIPTCHVSNPLQCAHIDPVKNDGKNDFFNLIVLCANCHGRFHSKTEKYMTIQEMVNIKKNLVMINGRYCSFEIRVIEYFMENPGQTTIELWGRKFDVMYLIKDGLLVELVEKRANAIGFPPICYKLTEAGIDFINKWKTAILLIK